MANPVGGIGPSTSSAEQSAPRPNVLAYPSATTARYLIFAAALICSGLFVGNWVHNDVRGDEWARTMASCAASEVPHSVSLDDFGPEGVVTREHQRTTECTKDVERTRAAFIFAGAAFVLAAALMLFLLTPSVVERKRRLRPLGPKLVGADERFAELAEQAEVSARVQARIGPAAQRDAFSYGIPMSNKVALPPAVAARWRDAATFDTVVAHELAHVARRDVSLAWLVRSIGYVMVPVLLVPIVVMLVNRDLSLVFAYSWRVIALGVVVLLLSNSLLRSREYDADLHAAAQLENPSQVTSLLARTTTRPRGRWAWLKARHPTAEQRVDAVAKPEIVTRVGLDDGLISGFLTALAVPLLISAFSTLLSTFGKVTGAGVLSAALVGPILGSAVGLALWRAAAVAKVVGRPVPVAPVAVGVGLGFGLGQVMSLGQTATGTATGFSHPWVLVIAALAGAGATAISASLGEVWADVVPGFATSTRAWLVGLAVNALLFSSVLWAANVFQQIIDLGGWGVGRWVLVVDLAPPAMTAIVGLVAAAAVVPLVWHPRRGVAPDWLIEAGTAPEWLRPGRAEWVTVVAAGMGSGLAGVCVIMAYRGMSGPPDGLDEPWQRYWSYVWIAAAVSVAAAIAVQLLVPKRGAAFGLASGVLATLTSSIGYFVFNASLGGGWDASVVGDFVQVAVVLGFYGTLIVSIGSLVTDSSRRSAEPAPTALVAVGSTFVAVVLSVTVLAAQEYVVPEYDLEVSTTLTEPKPEFDVVFDDLRNYLLEVLPQVEERYLPALAVAAQVDAGEFPGAEVQHLQTDVQQPLAALVEDMAAYEPKTAEVAEVHAHLLATLESATRGTDLLITAYAEGDTGFRDAALDEFASAARSWEQWLAARETLATAVLQQ